MRRWLLSLVLTGCVTTPPVPITVTRAMMTSLPPPMSAQITPDELGALWAGAQTAPFTREQAGSPTGMQTPGAQPGAGTLFRVAGHLLLGGEFHLALTNWANPAADGQPRIVDGVMFGSRLRLGGVFVSEVGLGLMGTVEPGWEVLPWTTSLGGYQTESTLKLTVGGSLTPFYERGPFRIFAGGYATTVPTLTKSLSVLSNCSSACAAPGSNTVGMVALTAGARVAFDGWAMAAAVTVPLTRDELDFAPMVALTVSRQWAGSSESEAHAEEPPDPPARDEADELPSLPSPPQQL